MEIVGNSSFPYIEIQNEIQTIVLIQNIPHNYSIIYSQNTRASEQKQRAR